MDQVQGLAVVVPHDPVVARAAPPGQVVVEQPHLRGLPAVNLLRAALGVLGVSVDLAVAQALHRPLHPQLEVQDTMEQEVALSLAAVQVDHLLGHRHPQLQLHQAYLQCPQLQLHQLLVADQSRPLHQ